MTGGPWRQQSPLRRSIAVPHRPRTVSAAPDIGSRGSIGALCAGRARPIRAFMTGGHGASKILCGAPSRCRTAPAPVPGLTAGVVDR